MKQDMKPYIGDFRQFKSVMTAAPGADSSTRTALSTLVFAQNNFGSTLFYSVQIFATIFCKR